MGDFLFICETQKGKSEMDTEEKKDEQTEKVEEKATEKVAPATTEALQKQLEELQRHAKNKEEEAARVQKKLETFQAAEDKRKKDELSEVERLKLEKKEAEEKATQAQAVLIAERTKYEVLAEAGKAQFGDKKQKFINPEIAFRLLSDEDKAKGILVALNELAKANPFLIEQPAANGDGVGSPKKEKSKSLDEKAPVYKIPRF
jgi:chromatin segregation and condensation protein Rec8/ScpA/Scc1 (kleisin family)